MSEIQLVLSVWDENRRKGVGSMVPASWDITGSGARREGTGSTSSREAKAALPHSKSSQEISADLVNLPTCRSLPKSAARLGGAPLAEWESLHPAAL